MTHKGRKLRVSIGPSNKTLTVYNVNDDSKPVLVESPHFIGHVCVRVKDFNGIAPVGSASPIPSTEYFGTRRRQFSIQVTGRFKEQFRGEDIVFGATFDNKVTSPYGTWIAIQCAKVIDPALDIKLDSDTPYFLSPLLCAMNTFNVQRASKDMPDASRPTKDATVDSLTNSTNSLSITNNNTAGQVVRTSGSTAVNRELSETATPGHIGQSSTPYLPEWKFGGAVELEESTTGLLKECTWDPQDYTSRRKYFQKASARQDCILTPDNIYSFEIFAPFINLNTFDLSLGLNFNIFRALNGQPIRLCAKCRKSDKTFFVCEFALVHENQEDSTGSLSTSGSSSGDAPAEEGQEEDEFEDAQEGDD